MSAQNNARVRIRLSIDVPVGVAVDSDGQRLASGRETFEKRLDRTIPPAGGNACAKEVAGSRFGSLAITALYPVASPPFGVKAICYPDSILPTLSATTPCPAGAILGADFDAKARWVWSDAKRVPGADFSAAGVVSWVAFWTQARSSDPFLYDTAVNLVCYPDGSASCSGSSSGSGMKLIGEELAGAASLLLTVAGAHYVAGRIEPGAWGVVVGTTFHRLTISGADALAVSGGGKTARSKSVSANPFLAILPGCHFGVADDAVVIA